MIGPRHFHHHLTHPHAGMSEFGKLFWAHTLRMFSISLVTVLVAIYLQSIGFSFREVMFFYLAQGVSWLVFVFPSMHMIARIGPNRSMAVASVFVVGYLFTLLTMERFDWPLWFPALAWGAMVAPYWFALRVNFSHAVDQGKVGRQVGLVAAVVLGAMGVAPAFGGLLASSVGIGVVYVAALILTIVAFLPLIGSQERFTSRRPDLRRVPVRKILPDLVANGCYTMEDLIGVAAWPLLIYLLIPSYAGVGVLSSVIVISAMAISLFVGKHEEIKGEQGYIREGSWLYAAGNALRLMAINSGFVFGSNFLVGAGHALIETPFTTRYYKHANESPRLEYIFWMQIASAAGWVVLALAFYLLAQVLPPRDALVVGIALSVPAALGIRRMR